MVSGTSDLAKGWVSRTVKRSIREKLSRKIVQSPGNPAARLGAPPAGRRRVSKRGRTAHCPPVPLGLANCRGGTSQVWQIQCARGRKRCLRDRPRKGGSKRSEGSGYSEGGRRGGGTRGEVLSTRACRPRRALAMELSADYLREKLQRDLEADHVVVEDTTLNRCATSFRVLVVSAKFEGKPLLQRHRLVNECLAEELPHIHAFEQKTLTPEQWTRELQK